jgi:NTE family protein
MIDAATGQAGKTTEIGLVLQGGGALGAYEYAVILAVFDLMDEEEKKDHRIALKVVTGVSIGAINAACVVGAPDRTSARKQLDELWSDFMIRMPPFVPAAVSSNVAFFQVPNFYTFMPGWTYLYNTQDLLKTLPKHVSFKALNDSGTALVITAVDVESGQLTWFANRQVGDIAATKIEPRHVLASGSLAPQFPWTDITEGAKVHHYWDGGIVDNTPLGAAIDAFDPDPNVRKLLVVMNLFPLASNLPQSFAEVSERVDQLRFGNRLRQDSETARLINVLIKTIDGLATLAGDRVPQDLRPGIDLARTYKVVQPIEISLGPNDSLQDPYGFRDFSRQGIERRRDRGRATALSTLRPFFNGPIAA